MISMKNDPSHGTMLYSWDVFKILLDYEVHRCQRYPGPLSLLDMIVESKEQPPDVIQANVATILNSHLRSADVPARFQDEFFVLLPGTSESGGRAVCERLLSLFEGPFPVEPGKSYSLSARMGLTTHPGGPDLAAEVLLQQASSALKHTRSQDLKRYVLYSELD
jgi:hypothetical protein